MRNIFLFGFIVSLSFSCAQKQEEQKASLLASFWKNEIARLQKEKPLVTKISTVNGKTDTIKTDSINWTNELHMFVKNDLNDNELALYDVDTNIVHDTLITSDVEGNVKYLDIPATVIVFNAKSEEQKLRKIVLSVYKPYSRVEIIIKDNQQLYGLNKRLIYDVTSGYTIEGSQDIKFLNGINYKAEVKFEK